MSACAATEAQAPTRPQAPRAERLELRVSGVTSSTVTVSWRRGGAAQARIYIAPEPAAQPTEPLPDAIAVATVRGDPGTYRIERISAATNVFVRVEVDGPRGVRAANVAAKTSGGPRATLSSPVREVHAMSPRIVQIVIAGGDGEGFETGRWRIERRTGRPLAVRAVRRHSVPVSQPSYEIGPGAATRDQPVLVDHRIYLVLAEPIGSREVLHVQGPFGVDFRLPFSDRYLETPSIQLNQVGYNPRATARYAYVSAWLGDGGAMSLASFPSSAQVLREPTDASRPRTDVACTVPIRLRARIDSDSGTAVSEMDLSRVPAAEGARYRIRIAGVGVSWPTAVSELATLETFFVTARGLFHNRWGGDLRASLTAWSRPADHRAVYTAEQADAFEMLPESTPRRGARSLRGGYHDAGDFDQRPTHTVVPQLLMRAYELAPDLFSDRQLVIPESGNGIPDLLDEALWGVAAWEGLQERDGGVRGGVESFRHPDGIFLASDDRLPYWTFARNPNVTARAAGVFAQASYLVRRFDGARAARLRERAERAYRWARAHGAASWFAIYGAGELLRLTGDQRYKNDFEQMWRSLGGGQPVTRFSPTELALSDYGNDDRIMPDYVIGYLKSGRASAPIAEAVVRRFTEMADEAARSVLSSPHGHRSARPAGYPPDWGQGVVQARYMDPIIARLALGVADARQRQLYFDAMSVAADYVLGANPEGMVYITGLGSRRPEEPLHLDSLVWIKRGRGPVPGIPVYGPVEEMPGADYYAAGAAAFYPPFHDHPLMRRYGDVRTFVNMNEFSVWEAQAPHTEHFALLIAPR